MGLFSLGGSVSNQDDNNDTTTNSTSNNTSTKNSSGTSTSTGTQTNSGSTNTSAVNGTSSTSNSGSVNTGSTINSGSVNTTNVGGSTSSTVNSGSVNTSQLLLSQDAVDYLVKGILEGTQGLAATTAGQHSVGAYNSTTQGMLTDDLVARTAGEVAARSAVTQTTTGPSSSTTTNSGNTTTQQVGSSTSNSTQNIGASTSTASTQNTGTNVIGGSTTTGNQSTNSSSVDDIVAAATQSGNSSTSASSTKEAANSSLGWIVCSELYKQGRLDHRTYIVGSRVFASYSEFNKRGYYFWAVPSVKHLRKHPYSLYSRFLEAFIGARAEYLAAKEMPTRFKKTLLGAIANYSLYYLCCGLARTVARNYEVSETYNGVYDHVG